jgi:hypothetical protein
VSIRDEYKELDKNSDLEFYRAGACQIIITTPMEITKIRMQMYQAAPGTLLAAMCFVLASCRLVLHRGVDHYHHS